jgi:hypothetical protein
MISKEINHFRGEKHRRSFGFITEGWEKGSPRSPKQISRRPTWNLDSLDEPADGGEPGPSPVNKWAPKPKRSASCVIFVNRTNSTEKHLTPEQLGTSGPVAGHCKDPCLP